MDAATTTRNENLEKSALNQDNSTRPLNNSNTYTPSVQTTPTSKPQLRNENEPLRHKPKGNTLTTSPAPCSPTPTSRTTDTSQTEQRDRDTRNRESAQSVRVDPGKLMAQQKLCSQMVMNLLKSVSRIKESITGTGQEGMHEKINQLGKDTIKILREYKNLCKIHDLSSLITTKELKQRKHECNLHENTKTISNSSSTTTQSNLDATGGGSGGSGGSGGRTIDRSGADSGDGIDGGSNNGSNNEDSLDNEDGSNNENNEDDFDNEDNSDNEDDSDNEGCSAKENDPNKGLRTLIRRYYSASPYELLAENSNLTEQELKVLQMCFNGKKRFGNIPKIIQAMYSLLEPLINVRYHYMQTKILNSSLNPMFIAGGSDITISEHLYESQDERQCTGNNDLAEHKKAQEAVNKSEYVHGKSKNK